MRTIWTVVITVLMLVFSSGMPLEAVAQPDLSISEFTFEPDPPKSGRRVTVKIGVYNRGNQRSGDFTLAWWPGEKYKEPGCTWRVHEIAPKGGKIYTCTYFYPSWYANITTKVVADIKNEVSEKSKRNNTKRMSIRVLRP